MWGAYLYIYLSIYNRGKYNNEYLSPLLNMYNQMDVIDDAFFHYC